MKAVEGRLDRQWLELRECLLEGGALEDQLGAMRAAFFCGAHGAVAVLAQGEGAADALMAELHREVHYANELLREDDNDA